MESVKRKFLYIPNITQEIHMTPGWAHLSPQGHNLSKLGRGLLGDTSILNIKALGLLVSEFSFAYLPIRICLCNSRDPQSGPISASRGIILSNLLEV